MVYPFLPLVKSKTGSFRALSGSFGVFHSGALRAQKNVARQGFPIRA